MNDLRDGVLARRQFAAEVRRGLATLEWTSAERRIVIRCDRHQDGKRPKLAEAAPFLDGFVVQSRISWVPSDQLNLRPWLREHLLGEGLDADTLDDDAILSDWSEHLDAWGRGESAGGDLGPRWLQSREPHVITTMVMPDVPVLITPWIRCSDHLNDAEIVTLGQLAGAYRA